VASRPAACWRHAINVILDASGILKVSILPCRYNTVSAHYKENECMRQM